MKKALKALNNIGDDKRSKKEKKLFNEYIKVIGAHIDRCQRDYGSGGDSKEWRNNLWTFVAKFTSYRAKKLYKIYRHLLKTEKGPTPIGNSTSTSSRSDRADRADRTDRADRDGHFSDHSNHSNSYGGGGGNSSLYSSSSYRKDGGYSRSSESSGYKREFSGGSSSNGPNKYAKHSYRDYVQSSSSSSYSSPSKSSSSYGNSNSNSYHHNSSGGYQDGSYGGGGGGGGRAVAWTSASSTSSSKHDGYRRDGERGGNRDSYNYKPSRFSSHPPPNHQHQQQHQLPLPPPSMHQPPENVWAGRQQSFANQNHLNHNSSGDRLSSRIPSSDSATAAAVNQFVGQYRHQSETSSEGAVPPRPPYPPSSVDGLPPPAHPLPPPQQPLPPPPPNFLQAGHPPPPHSSQLPHPFHPHLPPPPNHLLQQQQQQNMANSFQHQPPPPHH